MGYYFISIGGSGAKIMESLIHLCAAGIMPNNDKLNILAIDPDTGNGNLERSSATLKNFKVLQNFEVGNDTPLFKTKISIIEPLPWKPVEDGKTLNDLMNYHAYKGSATGDLYEVLYTRKERTTTLDEGFRGHPSIGAATLAKRYALRDGTSSQWEDFKDNIIQDLGSGGAVKIFLAGSVFGGTGAAGIPTISRLLRDSLKDYGNRVLIGGALILPYFNFIAPDNDSEIFAHSENFLTNTKAALKYYAQKDNVFNAMYFIGDSLTTRVNVFSKGAGSQKNDAHVVDFYGALAAVDFFQREDAMPRTFNYIFHNEEKKFVWSDFPELKETTENGVKEFKLSHRFVKFARFIFAYIHFVKPVLKDLAAGRLPEYQYPWYVDLLKGVDTNTKSVTAFEEYTEYFATWLKQIETLSEREIALISSSMFKTEPAEIVNPDEFSSCGGTQTELDLHEVWYRLSESFNATSTANGFGKFLRRLYDVCEE